MTKVDFLRMGKADHNDEVLIIMESRTDLFEKIEDEVAQLHSYETFILQAIPILKLSKKVKKWLEESIQTSAYISNVYKNGSLYRVV